MGFFSAGTEPVGDAIDFVTIANLREGRYRAVPVGDAIAMAARELAPHHRRLYAGEMAAFSDLYLGPHDAGLALAEAIDPGQPFERVLEAKNLEYDLFSELQILLEGADPYLPAEPPQHHYNPFTKEQRRLSIAEALSRSTEFFGDLSEGGALVQRVTDQVVSQLAAANDARLEQIAETWRRPAHPGPRGLEMLRVLAGFARRAMAEQKSLYLWTSL